MMMNNSTQEFERLLGKAALALWSDFPRDVQERLFETAVAGDVIIRNHLASYATTIRKRRIQQSRPSSFETVYQTVIDLECPARPRGRADLDRKKTSVLLITEAESCFQNLPQPVRKNLCFREHRAWLRRRRSNRGWNQTRLESPTHPGQHLAEFASRHLRL